MKLSAVIAVYNEEVLLPYSLGPLVELLDEVIIVDGSEEGPSSDGTRSIIDGFSASYPDKIKYFSGTFRRQNGGWDAVEQWNTGLVVVTGDYVMRTAADIVYDHEDIAMARHIVESFPEKAYFYAPLLEFFVDTAHINMQDAMTKESALPRPLCTHPVWVKSELGLYCFLNQGQEGASTRVDIDWRKDIIFMPHVKRFHFAYVKPFAFQVAKIVKYIVCGEYGDTSVELLAKGETAVYEYAIAQAKSYVDSPLKVPYTGVYPKIAEPLRGMTAMDGYEEFVTTLPDKSGSFSQHA